MSLDKNFSRYAELKARATQKRRAEAKPKVQKEPLKTNRIKPQSQTETPETLKRPYATGHVSRGDTLTMNTFMTDKCRTGESIRNLEIGDVVKAYRVQDASNALPHNTWGVVVEIHPAKRLVMVQFRDFRETFFAENISLMHGKMSKVVIFEEGVIKTGAEILVIETYLATYGIKTKFYSAEACMHLANYLHSGETSHLAVIAHNTDLVANHVLLGRVCNNDVTLASLRIVAENMPVYKEGFNSLTEDFAKCV